MTAWRLVLLTIGLVPAVSVPGESPSRDPARASLGTDRQCSGDLQLTPVTTLGTDVPLPPVGYVLKTRHHVLTADLFHASEVQVFDLHGTAIGIIDRWGAGPERFRHVRALLPGEADTVHVFDSRLGRRVILSPELEVVGSESAPFQIAENGAAMIEHHGYVINGYVVGRDGYSLHLVDLDGRAVRSYGHGHDDPWGTVGSVRLVTRATEAGHFWAARHDRYEVDLWSAGGELVRTLRRTPGWWTIIQETELPAEEETGILVQTSSRVVGVQVDRRDRLIVISRTPTVGQNVVQVPTFADVSDVVVEALHPTTGRVLGVCRFADGLGGPAGHDHLFTFRELRPGRGKVIVWEVS